MDTYAVNGASKRPAAPDVDDEEEQETEDDVSRDSRHNHHAMRAAANETNAAAKRARRHHWQQKYESEFGLVAIEKDHATGDVVLAMCGFCKAFGREGQPEPPPPPVAEEAGDGTKKRRRRSLTTTKFFRAFRVDNIRSHLQGAHPRRWAEFELLPKQEAVRARFLQPQGESPYDALHMVDDVDLAEADMRYTSSALNAAVPAPPSASSSSMAAAGELPHVTLAPNTTATLSHASGSSSGAAAQLNGSYSTISTQPLTPMVAAGSARSAFDYEKHAAEQLALDRERLAFAKAKFKKYVELRERELALRERQLEQDRVLHEKRWQAALEAAQQEASKFFRLAEVLRDAVASAASGASAAAQSSSIV